MLLCLNKLNRELTEILHFSKHIKFAYSVVTPRNPLITYSSGVRSLARFGRSFLRGLGCDILARPVILIWRNTGWQLLTRLTGRGEHLILASYFSLGLIWKERNNRVFNHDTTPIHLLLHRISEVFGLWRMAGARCL